MMIPDINKIGCFKFAILTSLCQPIHNTRLFIGVKKGIKTSTIAPNDKNNVQIKIKGRNMIQIKEI